MLARIVLFDGFDPLDAIAPYEVLYARIPSKSSSRTNAAAPSGTTTDSRRPSPCDTPMSVQGTRNLIIDTPIGRQGAVLERSTEDGALHGVTVDGDEMASRAKAGRLPSSRPPAAAPYL